MRYLKLFEELNSESEDSKILDYLVFMHQFGYLSLDEIEVEGGEAKGYDAFLVYNNQRIGFMWEDEGPRENGKISTIFTREIGNTQYTTVIVASARPTPSGRKTIEYVKSLTAKSI